VVAEVASYRNGGIMHEITILTCKGIFQLIHLLQTESELVSMSVPWSKCMGISKNDEMLHK